jgi:integrase
VKKARDRTLTDAELRAIWAETAGYDYSAIVRLLLLTGCRADEIGSLSWAEVFGDRIVLPGTARKVVPLRA